MVSNLLVVLCGERAAQPIVNTRDDVSLILESRTTAEDRLCAPNPVPLRRG